MITSQLLSAPALWDDIPDIRACRRVFAVFYTAALQLSQQSTARPRPSYKPVASLQKEQWTKAVVEGADDRSPRWRHVLVLGAILLGFEEKQKRSLPSNLRSKLESALVTATNLALQGNGAKDPVGKYALVFVLNHTFELLTDHNRAQLDYDLVLPTSMEAVFVSKEGLEHGYWLSILDQDVVESGDKRFNWSAKSSTYHIIREMQDRPLVASLGPLSRLIAHSVENISDSTHLLRTLDRLADFARILSISWRQNKLSEIDISEELDFLDVEAAKTTLPVLWHVLRLSLFATVIILRAVVGRLLGDAILHPISKLLSLQFSVYISFEIYTLSHPDLDKHPPLNIYLSAWSP